VLICYYQNKMNNNKVSLQKILPFTEARNNLSQLVERVAEEQYFIVSKQNRPKAVLVDLDYFLALQGEAEKKRMGELEAILKEKFAQYLKKTTKKKKITEKEAYRLLTGEDLTW